MTTPTLTQTVRVMPLLYGGPFGDDDLVAFGQRGEQGEPDQDVVLTSLTLRGADWRDMGEPTAVTVTIRPGDELNVSGTKGHPEAPPP